MYRAVPLLLALSGCTFQPSGSARDDDDSPGGIDPGSGVDASQLAGPDAGSGSIGPGGAGILPPDGQFGGSSDLVIDSPMVIDTTSLIASPPLPDGVEFDTWPQLRDGPELAVLHVRGLDLGAQGQLRVFGHRPLVIYADGAVVMSGVVDVSADRAFPGPGGSPPGSGRGDGSDGSSVVFTARDGGGGGGGAGSSGGAGGDALADMGTAAPGGSGGSAFLRDYWSLVGGSGGGSGRSCPTAAGAGGGALYVYSAISIELSGTLDAGGGGGGGGLDDCLNSGSGSGGGAGGSIVLQAPALAISGIVAANGGGGGGAAGDEGDGDSGADASIGDQPAIGGQSGGLRGAAGGGGAAGATPAMPGASDNSGRGNGGGGGGGAGIIRLLSSYPPALAGRFSPAAESQLY